MKRIIYILILIGVFAFNLEVKAEWIERDGFFYMKDSLDAIRDFKVSEDGEIIAITKDNQIIKYDFETGEIKKRCKCEGDENYNQFAFVSKDFKTTSIVYNFDTLNNENVAYNLAIINNDDCSRIIKQKINIPNDYRVHDRYFNFSFIDFILKDNILINSLNVIRGIKLNGSPIDWQTKEQVISSALMGITSSYKLEKNTNSFNLVFSDSIKINSYSYQINENAVYFSGFNIFIRDEAAYPYTLANGHQSKFCKLNLENGRFETIGEFNFYAYEDTKEFDESNKYLSYMIENKENKVFLISNGRFFNLSEGYPGNEEQWYEYNSQDKKFIFLKKTSNYFWSNNSKWQFSKLISENKSIRNNNFTFNYKHINGILYSNYMADHNSYYDYSPDSTKYFINDFQNDKNLDSFFINFDYTKVEAYIPKKLNQSGGALFLKDSTLCLKKNRYFDNVIKDNFGISNTKIREDENFNLNSYTNTENLIYKWNVYNEFNQYEFETNNRKFDCNIPNSGVYNINLKIIYNDNIIANITKDTILTVYPKLKAEFEVKIDKQYQDIIYLSNISLGKINKYEWELDNGVKSNEQNISFRKYNETNYKIKLKIYDDIGIDSIVKSINLNDKLNIKNSKYSSIIDYVNNKFMDLIIDNENLVISSIKSTWKKGKSNNDNNQNNIDFEINFEKKITNLNMLTFYPIKNKNEIFQIEQKNLHQQGFSFVGVKYLYGSYPSKYKETKNNTDIMFLENNLTFRNKQAFAFLTKNNTCVLNDFLYFGIYKRYSYQKQFSIDTLLLNIDNFKTYNYTNSFLPLDYTTYELFADNINNQIVGLIRKDSSNNFEIFETNEKLELKRRDLSLPFDMEINEVKLINENKLAIVGHKKHQYTKGIGAIVIVDLRDLSFVVKEHNSRPTINNLRKINNSYYYAFGDVIGSQGYMIFDANFDLVKDIRLTDLEGELKDVEYLDNKFYLATEEHYLDTVTPFRIEDKYKIRLYMDSVEVDLNEDITSIEGNPENQILIFPNPSSEKITLDLGGMAVADLVIYDILGNEIMSIPNYTNKSEIDISILSIGTYTIQIQTSTGIISQRLLVNR